MHAADYKILDLPEGRPFVMSAGGRVSSTWRRGRLTGRNGRESRPHASAGSANMSQQKDRPSAPLRPGMLNLTRMDRCSVYDGRRLVLHPEQAMSLSRAGVNPCESSAVVFDHARYSQVEPLFPRKTVLSSDLLHQLRNIFCKETDGRNSLGIHPDLSRVPTDHHVPVVRTRNDHLVDQEEHKHLL